MPLFGALRVGRIVAYFDANGNLKPAVVTAIRDGTAGKVRLSVFNEGGTLTDADNVAFNTQRVPATWQPFEFSADRFS